MIEKICDTPEKAEQVEVGGAWAELITPDGQTIGEPITGNNEGIIYADIDLEARIFPKDACDVVCHYARPDLLQLWFNRETPKTVREVPMALPTANKWLGELMSNYEGLKQQIYKSGEQDLVSRATEFENRLKSLRQP